MLDLPVVREAAHGVDGLVSQIVVGGSVVLDQLREKRKHTLTPERNILGN